MDQFEYSFRDDEHDMRRDIHILGFIRHGIEAALQDTKNLHLLKILLFSTAGLNLINQLHPGVLIDSVDLVHVGTDTTVLLRPQFGQPQNVFAIVILVPTR